MRTSVITKRGSTLLQFASLYNFQNRIYQVETSETSTIFLTAIFEFYYFEYPIDLEASTMGNILCKVNVPYSVNSDVVTLLTAIGFKNNAYTVGTGEYVAPPVTNFSGTPTSGTVPLTVDFTDLTTGSPYSWAWDFKNDGTATSTQQNPSYTYTVPGTYSVKLTTQNRGGSNSLTKVDYISVGYISPTADFTASPTTGIVPATISFTDTSAGNPTSWLWDFKNDGTATSTLQNPSYTYTETGIYSVKLTVTNPAGTNSLTKVNYITVVALPTANFSADPVFGSAPLAVQFADLSENTPTSWLWDFKNDGTATSTQQNPSYTYTQNGTYSVKLTVTNTAGTNSLTKVDYISVGAVPATVPYDLNSIMLPGYFNGSSNNNTFIDRSSNNFTITRMFNTTQGSFNPFTNSNPSYSVLFNGSTDYITVQSSSSLAFGTGDFTIECWVYPTTLTQAGLISNLASAGIGDTGIELQISSTYYPYVLGWFTNFLISNTPVTLNSWNHIAVVRSGTSMALFLNGTRTATNTSANNFSSTSSFVIGKQAAAATTFAGYISNVRMVKGKSIYNPANSRISVPVSQLSSVSGTSLLTCQSSIIVDNSGNSLTLTPTGSPTTSLINPFILNNGYYSNVFDGNSSYLSVSSNSALAPGTGDFTIECWMNFNTVDVDVIPICQNDVIGASSSDKFFYCYSPAAALLLFGQHGPTTPVIGADWIGLPNVWYHLAVVRQSGTVKFFVDGTQIPVTYDTPTALSGVSFEQNGFIVGAISTPYYCYGSISNFRYVVGTAVYSSSFVTSTRALYPVANTALLTCQDAEILDNSVNAFPVTANGTVASSILSSLTIPNGYYSSQFSGSGYLTTVTSANLFLPNNADWTIEMWVYIQSISTTQYLIYNATGSVDNWTNNNLGIYINTSGYLTVEFSNGSSNVTLAGTNVLATNAYSHVAVVYNGTNKTVTTYINGARDLNAASMSTYSPSGTPARFTIGRNDPIIVTPAYPLTGKISNLRVTNTQVYTTATFSPPKYPLTSITGTRLLTCQSKGFIDNSSNSFAITATNVNVSSNSPFIGASMYNGYAKSGSAYFDGVGDFLYIDNNAGFNFGTGQFTVEAWIYPTSISAATFKTIVGKWASGNDNWLLLLNETNNVRFYFNGAGSPLDSSATIVANQWTHVAVTRDSSNQIRIFVNGAQSATTSSGFNSTNSAALEIGSYNGGGALFTGYISNLRIVKGTAVYTAAFTTPEAPLQAISGTQLLLDGTNAGIVDITGKNVVETISATVSTSVSRWGAGSMYFNGSSYLSIPATQQFAFGTGDFTIEFWVNCPADYGSTYLIYDQRSPDVNRAGFDIFIQQSAVRVSTAGEGLLVGNISIIQNTWTHVAITRSGTTARLFVNGILDATNATATWNITNSIVKIGNGLNGWMSGYIQDLRIVKGFARYTASGATPSAMYTMAEVLVVGGGGGGDLSAGGGGGGGGALLTTINIMPNTTYVITVGAGGAARAQGSNSSINADLGLSGIGGGYGGYFLAYNSATAGGNGGSGGGGAAIYPGTMLLGGTAVPGQGNAGGSNSGGWGAFSSYSSGGGGGAGTVGQNAVSTTGGSGGDGINYYGTYYAGGGGGGYVQEYTVGTGYSSGGLGGGGRGVNYPNYLAATSGEANTGGGGGAGQGIGGTSLGGSGIVIIRYPSGYGFAASTVGSPTVNAVSGYIVYTFTSSGSITF